jgi:hypothetical protein
MRINWMKAPVLAAVTAALFVTGCSRYPLSPTVLAGQAVPDPALRGAFRMPMDVAGLVGPDGSGVVSPNGGQLLGPDGSSLVGPDGSAVVARRGEVHGRLIVPTGLVAAGAGNLVAAGAGNLVGPDGVTVRAGALGRARVVVRPKSRD